MQLVGQLKVRSLLVMLQKKLPLNLVNSEKHLKKTQLMRTNRGDNRRIISPSVDTCSRYIAENGIPSCAIIRLVEMEPAHLVMDSKLNMIVRP